MTLIEVNERRDDITQRQRWSHYFVFIYALIAVFIGFNLRSTTLDATTPYVNNQVGIRALYPQHWLIDTSGNYVFRVRDLSQSGFKTTLQVAVQPVTISTTGRNLLDTLTLNRSQTYSGYKVLSQQDNYKLPDGQNATAMYYVYVVGDDNPFLKTVPSVVQGLDILSIRRGQAIIITYLSDAQTFDDNLPTFERFLDDLQF